MKSFYIKCKGSKVLLEHDSNKTRFDVIEKLMLVFGVYLIEKKKGDRLSQILSILRCRLEECPPTDKI